MKNLPGPSKRYTSSVDLSGLKFTSSSTYTIVGEIGPRRHGHQSSLAEKKQRGRRGPGRAEDDPDQVGPTTRRASSRKRTSRRALRHENIVKTYGLEAIPYSQLLAGVPAGVRQAVL